MRSARSWTQRVIQRSFSKTEMYRPLPECLTIQTSPIHGLGLFSTQSIPADYTLGISHVKMHSAEREFIRTPLGGFVNHSDDPNCIKGVVGSCMMMLKTLREIVEGEELTVEYTLYSIKD